MRKKNTAQIIREEAAELFASKGYEGTSLREVAALVGVQVGSLYNHIANKEDLLLQIMGTAMDDVLEQAQEAVAESTDPTERMIRLLRNHFRFHAENARIVFIGNTELRSLSESSRKNIYDKRRQYSQLIEREIIALGEATGAKLFDPKLHTYSLLAKATHLASWFHEGGPIPLEEIIHAYTVMSLREMGIHDADSRVKKHFTVNV